ncbi:MAG: tRNA (N6-isopentenyl adenosine(37)-C2)-methylthiotransferase MiaB [Kiritimatiellae bacterium]|nr:tRNA (N6-isopentenyl adenosine(37)-C2)-methylthiotransferase MiaB [Kiritimatiellia bacterium]
MKVYIETYGCQMNVNDTEVVFSILAKAGYTRTESMDEADVIMANTCSVRDNAEQRIWGRVEVFNQQRKSRPGVVVGILGCMAERLKDSLTSTGKVDIVAGPDSYRRLPEMLAGLGEGPQMDVRLSRDETYDDIVPLRTDKNGVSAFISIMRGCNNVCSYCVVPYTRGVERSRDAHTIVREACDVFTRGYREVTLLGQNVDSYRWTDADGRTVDFALLLEMVACVNPELRVRFATSNPQDISDEVLLTMARHDNICKHIHLPVQSGDSRVLALARRHYDEPRIREILALYRRSIPGLVLGGDFITGLPGEDEAAFENTRRLIADFAFDRLHVFPFSPRPGTEAASLPGAPTRAVARERAAILRKMAR